MMTMNDIREMLCQEINKLREDKTTPVKVNAITNATGKLLATVKLELEYAKLTNKTTRVGQFLELEESKTPEASK